jgi:hypothetical protein
MSRFFGRVITDRLTLASGFLSRFVIDFAKPPPKREANIPELGLEVKAILPGDARL